MQENIEYERQLFQQKEQVHQTELKALRRQILVSNLKAWIIGIILLVEIIFIIGFLKESKLFGEDNLGDNKIAIIRYNKEVTEDFTTKVMEKITTIFT